MRVAYVNNVGGIVSISCNQLGREIWEICISSKVWLTAVHVPGKPEIDLFASCLNYEMTKYVSWHSDENAVAIDAFIMSSINLNFYAFLPCSLIGAVLAKIRQEQCSGIMVIPWWKTQVWFPMMVKLLVNFPVLLPPNILTLPWKKSVQHPLYPKMKLLAVQLSGRHSETQVFHQKLLTLSHIRGEQQLKVDINWYSDDGSYVCYIKEYGSLYCSCEYSVGILARYVPGWVFL